MVWQSFWFGRLQRQTSVCTVVNIYLLLCEVFDTLTSKMTFVTFCRRVICCVFGNVTCWQLAVSLITDCLPKVIFFHFQYFRYLDFDISDIENFMSDLSFQQISNSYSKQKSQWCHLQCSNVSQKITHSMSFSDLLLLHCQILYPIWAWIEILRSGQELRRRDVLIFFYSFPPLLELTTQTDT